MPPLIRFLLVNMTAGFLIGLVVGVAFMQTNDSLFEGQPLGTAMLLWGFVASFGMGALGTGLALLPLE